GGGERGGGARGHRRVGRGRRDGVHGIDRGHAASGKGGAHFRAVQIREPGVSQGEDADQSERHGNRRRRVCGNGGAVLGGVRETDHAGSGRRGESGRETAARRRIKAANFTVRFSGHGRGRIEIVAESEEGNGTGDHHGSDDGPRRGFGGAVCRRDASGRTKHAELHAAEGAGKMRKAGAAEAWIEQYGERVADVGGIYRGARESGRDFVRAGDSHV